MIFSMIVKLKHILLIILLTLLPAELISQVKIDLSINNYNDSLFYLMKYKSDKTYVIVDTTSLSYDKKTFSNKDNYDEGIYLVTDSQQNPLFEILIGKDQKFSVSIEELMDLNSYKVKGSKETSMYFDIYAKTTHNKLYVNALKSEIKYNPNNVAKIDSIKKELLDYQKSKINTRKDLFLNYYIKYTMDFIVPQEYMIDKKNCEQYIIEHYFDDLPLCDSRILNSRLLKNKLDNYFNNHIATQPSNIICDKIDDLLSRTTCCNEIRDYILWYLYSKYFNSYEPKNEFVYIHLTDRYFASLDIVNLTQSIRNEIVERADVLRKITIGQQSPALSYIDDKGNTVNLAEINNANIVLFFHKPDCQKCIRDKRILNLIEKRVKDLTVLSINISEDNYHNVSEAITETFDIMTTPTIYLLDEDKKIIAKHIKAEEIEFHIKNTGK